MDHRGAQRSIAGMFDQEELLDGLRRCRGRCDATFAADTKDGLLGKIIDHAASAHGIVEVTPEVAAAIGAAIRQS